MQKDYSEPGFTKKNLIDTGNFDTPVGGCRDFLPSVVNFPPFRRITKNRLKMPVL
jgi:hypothetical protein